MILKHDCSHLKIYFCIFSFLFYTRKLPDNFNESLYIFFSAATTIIVWLAFLPTYFLTHDATYRQLLLPAASLLNVYTMLVGLCFPRVYVVIKSRWRHSQASLQVTRWRSTSSTMVTSNSSDNMRVTYMRANSTSPAPSYRTSNDTLTSCASPVPSHKATPSVSPRTSRQISTTSGASGVSHRLSQQISQTSSGAPSISPRLYRQMSTCSSTPSLSTGHAPVMCKRCSSVISTSLSNISSGDEGEQCVSKVWLLGPYLSWYGSYWSVDSWNPWWSAFLLSVRTKDEKHEAMRNGETHGENV